MSNMEWATPSNTKMYWPRLALLLTISAAILYMILPTTVDTKQIHGAWKCDEWVNGDKNDREIMYRFDRNGRYLWTVSKGENAYMIAFPGSFKLSDNSVLFDPANFVLTSNGRGSINESETEAGKIDKLTENKLQFQLQRRNSKFKFECLRHRKSAADEPDLSFAEIP